MPRDRPEAHILRRTPLAPRRPGRPSGTSPLFLEDAFTIDAVTEPAKARGAWIGDDSFVRSILEMASVLQCWSGVITVSFSLPPTGKSFSAARHTAKPTESERDTSVPDETTIQPSGRDTKKLPAGQLLASRSLPSGSPISE